MTPPSATTRLIAMLALGVFAGTLQTRITDPIVAVLAQDFGATTARVALIASAYALPFALIQPILGPVGDAMGKRRVITVALSVLTIMLIASAFVPNLDSLLVVRALAGLAAGGVMPLTIAMVGDAVPVQGRQVALSRLLAVVITGQIAGGSMSGLLEPYLGWRGVMLAASVLPAIAVAGLILGGRALPSEPHARFDPIQAIQRYRQIMRMPAARVLYISVAIEGGCIFGVFPYFAPMLRDSGLGSTAEAGMTVAAFGVGGLIYAAIAKPLLHRIGPERLVQLGGGLCLVAQIGFALAPSAWAFMAAGLLLGTGMYMIHNFIQTRVTELAPHARGSAVALHAFHFYGGQTIGPVVIGLMLRRLGEMPAMALSGLALLALAFWLGRLARGG